MPRQVWASLQKMWQYLYSHLILLHHQTKHQYQLIPKSHFLTLLLSEYLPTCKVREVEILEISNWSVNTEIWLDKRAWCDKLWNENAWKLSLFYFVFHPILFSMKLHLLRSLWEPPAILCSLGHTWPYPTTDLVEFFSYSDCLSTFKKSVRSSHSNNRYLWSKNLVN